MTLTDPVDDAGLRARLHDSLEAVHRSAEAPPVGWARLEGRMRAVRRRRRAAAAGGTVAVLSALAVGVQAGPLPYPHWAPAIVASSEAGFGDRPTAGSLAGDTAWLDALRAERSAPIDESGGERWTAVPGGIRVLFAGDVGAYRLALVEEERRWGAIQGTSAVWLMGPRGAAVGALVENGGGAYDLDGAAAAVGLVYPEVLPADERPATGGAVLVALGLGRATVWDPPGPDGSRTPRTVTPGPDGVIVVTATAGRGTVQVDFPQVDDDAVLAPVGRDGRILLAPDLPMTAATLPRDLLTAPLHGGSAATDDARRREDLAAAANQLARESDGATATSWRTLWTASRPDPSGDRPTGVVAMTLADGTHRLYVERTLWMGVVVDVPAGPLDATALAVRWPSTDELTRQVAAPDRVALLGPVGAVRAVLHGPGADAPGDRAVDLVEDAALVDAPGVTFVSFVDVAGRELVRVPVRAWG